jgi:uncharacterized protein (DUF362 family)
MFLTSNRSPGEVFLVKNSERNAAVKSLMDCFDLENFADKKVALKANFNSADPFPASTHIDTLRAITETLVEAKTTSIVMGERSGMGNTKQVLEEMGVFELSKAVGFQMLVLDEASKDDWVKIDHDGTHWLKGFYISKLFKIADKVVQTCCLKAHRFGGHFTLSLKNSVGLVAKKLPGTIYDYMWELHGSPYQRQMIAEINKEYSVDLVIMDGTCAFIDGGPEKGTQVQPNLILASSDRVAIDAVGIAILRGYGATSHIMKGRIFELEQLKRAAELNLGVKSASEIKLTPLNDESREDANKISQILESQG